MFYFLGSSHKTLVVVIVQMVKSLLKLLLAYVAERKKPFTSEIIFASLAFGKFIDIYLLSWVLLFPPQMCIFICPYIYIFIQCICFPNE